MGKSLPMNQASPGSNCKFFTDKQIPTVIYTHTHTHTHTHIHSCDDWLKWTISFRNQNKKKPLNQELTGYLFNFKLNNNIANFQAKIYLGIYIFFKLAKKYIGNKLEIFF